MVDTCAFSENHVTAQVGGVQEACQPHEAKHDGSNTIPRTSEEAQDKGKKIEERGARIKEGMIEANASLSTVGITPIGQAGHNRTHRCQEAYDHSNKGSIHCPGGMSDQPDDVKDGGEHPGRDGYIGQHPLQRMSTPVPID